MQRLSEINQIEIAPHFILSEFACPCCQQVMLHPQLLKKLSELRKMLQRPVYITSGYRCINYNRQVGGAQNSYHLIGLAADIRVIGLSILDLLDYVEMLNFTGIGLYEQKNFLHLDIRPTKPARWRE